MTESPHRTGSNAMIALKKIVFVLAIPLELAAIAILIYLIYGALFPPEYWQSLELKQNLEKWESHNITHYRMSYTIGCFCESYYDGSMPLTVEVKDEEVVTVVDGKGRTLSPDSVMTIATLFRYANSSIWDPTNNTDVKYDPTLGYPKSIGVAPKEPIPDVWISYSVENLQSLPP